MARFNEILVGRYNRVLQKLFAMKGEPPAPQLASDIQPSIAVEDVGVESRYLVGWDRFGLQIQLAAGGAATRAQIKMRNPAISNVVAVVEGIVFEGALTDEPFLNLERPSSTDLAAFPAADVTGLDARTIRKTTALILSQNNAGAVVVPGNGIWIGRYPAASMLQVIVTDHQELTLLPGDGLTLAMGTQNQAGGFAAFWRERFLEDSERA